MDKAGLDYWEQNWSGSYIGEAINPNKRGLNNYVNRGFHDYFAQLFANQNNKNNKLLEIGCAQSVWLPYFAKEFNFTIAGIDYSAVGCRHAREILRKENVKGEIVCADFFSPPGDMVNKYNIIVSFGVVEHFEDTPSVIKAFLNFLKPGGLIITIIPNIKGLIGFLQKELNYDVYNIHAAITPAELKKAHQMHGLEVKKCGYFLPANFGVVNLENLKNTLYYRPLLRSFSWLSKAIWVLSYVIPLKPHPFFSPYIICTAAKPEDKESICE